MFTDISIQYLDALCGSGKTHAIIKKAGQLARLGHKVMIVQPTMALIEETISKEVPKANLPVKPIPITSNSHSNHVIKALNNHLIAADSRGGGEIVW